MDGPERVGGLVRSHLTADLAGRLAAIEARLTLAAGTLPAPSVQGPADVLLLPLEQFPAVIVAPSSAGMVADQGRNGSGREYVMRYRVRVYTWARGEGYQATDDARNRYLLAVRESLFGRRSLSGAQARVMEPNWVESYVDGTLEADTARSISGGYVEFDLDLSEVLTP